MKSPRVAGQGARLCAPLATVLLLAGCGQPPPDPGLRVDQVRERTTEAIAAQHLRRQIDQSPRTLDPSFNTDVAGYRILDDLFEGLVRLDPAGRIVPAVAARWTVSADGRDWVFTLRDDARWSNGDRVTAQDFVYAWRRVVDPRSASESAQQLAPIVNAVAIASGQQPVEALGVEARDDRTLAVQLTAPTGYFPYLLTNAFLFPLHAVTVQTHGDSWTNPGNLVGNGAFVLAAHRINGAVQLRRNPQYWDAAAVRLNEVTYYPVPDRSAATSRYLAGDVDITDGFLVDDVGWLRQRVGGELLLSPQLAILMFGMHVGRPPFDSQPLRQAMSMAVDRELLTQKLMRGLYVPAYSLVPPLEDYPAVLPDWARLPREQRLARARELYAQAGYSREKPLRVELSYPTMSPDTRRLIEGLAAMWRTNLGAEVILANEEWRVHQQNRRLRKHDLFWDSWNGDYPEPLTFLSVLQRDNGQNFGNYDDPAYEKLMLAAAGSTDLQQRYAAYAAAEAWLNDTAPVIPIYYYQSRHLLRTYVRGWQSNVMDRNLSRDLYLAAGS